jgi:RNA polymerase sigma-70 factor (ECF subfamily)
MEDGEARRSLNDVSGTSDATWEQLLEHGQFLRALARALVADDSRAADVEQSTWLAVAEHPPNDAARARGWLRRVATNIARQFERGERRRARREAASATGEALPAAVAAAQEIEAQQLVLEAVRGLDDKYRTVIVLRFYEDLGTGAIAERLALPLATVRTQLQRALTILREQLDAKFHGKRGQWQRALVPLAGEIARHVGAPAVAAIALLTLGLVIAGWWSVHRRTPRPAPALPATSAPAAQAGPKAAAAPPSTPADEAAAHRESVATRDRFDGLVVDSMGRPIEGARIDLFDDFSRRLHGSKPKQAVRSDTRGRFALVDVGFGEWDVVVSRDGFVTSRAYLERSLGGSFLRTLLRYEPRATIVLEDARTVRGVVVDPNGRPVTAAAVIEFDQTRCLEGIPSEATVDERGCFELSGVPLETVEIIAVAPGLGVTPAELRNGQGEMTIRMSSAPSCSLDVTVCDAQGRPLTDTEVELTLKAPTSFGLPFLPQTNQLPSRFAVRPLPAEGRLVRSDLPPGDCEVHVWSHAPVDPIPAATVVLDPAAPKSLELRASAPRTPVTLRGVVKECDGTPIANTVVVAGGLAKPAPTARTDAQGRFEITAATSSGGGAGLFLDDCDRVLLDPKWDRGVVGVDARATSPLELTAEHAASIHGRAATAEGAPAGDVVLELHVVGADRRDVLATAITDPNGHFAFDSLPPRSAPAEVVVVRGSTHEPLPERFDLRAGSIRGDVALIVPPIGSIRGRVLDSKGNPKPGVRMHRDLAPAIPEELTNRAGEFLMADLPDGDYTVQVLPHDVPAPGDDSMRKVKIAEGRRVDGVEFTLDDRLPETASISGRIVLSGDGPRRGVQFNVDAINDAGEIVSGGTEPQNFRLDRLAPGHYRVLAKTAYDEPIAADGPVTSWVSKIVEAQTGGAGVVIDFPPANESARVLARFTSTEGELAGTQVDWELSTDLSEEEGQSVMAQRAQLGNGEFRLLVATPGTYRISFGIDFEGFFSRVVTVPARGDVDLGEIPIEKKKIHGVVTDRLGTPIANALVVDDSNLEWLMTIDQGAKPDPGTKRIKTDAKGEFTIPLGMSGLCFWKKGFAPRRFSSGEDPQPADNVFVLLPAADLKLTNFPAGMGRAAAVNWVVTLVWNDAESELHGYPAARGFGFSAGSGSLEFFRLPAGRHVLHLWKKTAESRSDDDPPPPAPNSSYAWPIELRAGEVTTFDIAAHW